MTRKKFKDTLRFGDGFILERPEIDAPEDYAADGSANVLFTGQGEPVPFKGLALVSGIGAIGATPVGDGIAGFGDTPYIVPTFAAPSGCPLNLTSSVGADNVVTVTNPNGADSSYERGFLSVESITTLGAIEFQFIYTVPDTVSHSHYIGVSNNKDSCAYPGFGGMPPVTYVGITALLQRATDDTMSLSTFSYDGSSFPDGQVDNSIQASSNIYKLTLVGGIWRLYRNNILNRTFVYDSAGGAMKINIGSAWANSEVRILRFTNESIF